MIDLLPPLRVLLRKNPANSTWFAQGIEIDYAAQAAQPEKLVRVFESGLFLTVAEHLRRKIELKKFFVPVTPEFLRGTLTIDRPWRLVRETPVAIYPEFAVLARYLPFSKIRYYAQSAERAEITTIHNGEHVSCSENG